jgi:hypothetical protein
LEIEIFEVIGDLAARVFDGNFFGVGWSLSSFANGEEKNYAASKKREKN